MRVLLGDICAGVVIVRFTQITPSATRTDTMTDTETRFRWQKSEVKWHEKNDVWKPTRHKKHIPNTKKKTEPAHGTYYCKIIIIIIIIIS